MLQVARDHHRTQAAELLNELVFKDPAQKVIWNDEGLQIWIGCKQAAAPDFATALGKDMVASTSPANLSVAGVHKDTGVVLS